MTKGTSLRRGHICHSPGVNLMRLTLSTLWLCSSITDLRFNSSSSSFSTLANVFFFPFFFSAFFLFSVLLALIFCVLSASLLVQQTNASLLRLLWCSLMAAIVLCYSGSHLSTSAPRIGHSTSALAWCPSLVAWRPIATTWLSTLVSSIPFSLCQPWSLQLLVAQHPTLVSIFMHN